MHLSPIHELVWCTDCPGLCGKLFSCFSMFFLYWWWFCGSPMFFSIIIFTHSCLIAFMWKWWIEEINSRADLNYTIVSLLCPFALTVSRSLHWILVYRLPMLFWQAGRVLLKFCKIWFLTLLNYPTVIHPCMTPQSSSPNNADRIYHKMHQKHIKVCIEVISDYHTRLGGGVRQL